MTDTNRLAALLHQRHIDVVPNLCYGCESEAARLIAAGVVHHPAAPAEGLRDRLERLLSEPTTDFHTFASKALFDKAMRSPTQEVTITAQALRMALPAIEGEAVHRALRAALMEPT